MKELVFNFHFMLLIIRVQILRFFCWNPLGPLKIEKRSRNGLNIYSSGNFMGGHFNLSEPLAIIYNITLHRAKFK